MILLLFAHKDISSDFSPRLDAFRGLAEWRGFAGCGKTLQAVILSEAKDPGSSRESVNRVNYGGSSPKMRAQNDSVFEFFHSRMSPALPLNDEKSRLASGIKFIAPAPPFLLFPPETP
jgi:hypothetical protein